MSGEQELSFLRSIDVSNTSTSGEPHLRMKEESAKQNPSGPGGKFFQVSLESVRRLLKSGGGALELGAYIVLCRGAGKHSTTIWTEHGVADRLGNTRGKVEKACRWLEENGFIRRIVPPISHTHEGVAVDADAVHKLAKNSTLRRHRWGIASEGEKILYLPNSLVDGLVKEAGSEVLPIKRLFSDVEVALRSGVNIHVARLDALALLIEMYAAQDIGLYGGVDPCVWHQKWVAEDCAIDDIWLNETGMRLVEIQRGCEAKLSSAFVNTAFAYIENSHARELRSALALQNLKKLGLFYEVLQVWDGDPTEVGDAEVLYPLYIFDRYAEESGDPVLYRTINLIAIEYIRWNLDQDMVFDPKNGDFILPDSGIFRYIVYGGTKNATALSTLRMRYRASDRDNGIGFEEQSRMVEEWKRELQALRE